MLRLIMAALLLSTLFACDSKKVEKGEKRDQQASTSTNRETHAKSVRANADDLDRNDEPYPYAAIVTCSDSYIHADPFVCFSGTSALPSTNLELKNGDKYGLYQAMDIDNLGSRTREGVRIKLARHFELTMQNASDSLILGVKIVNNVPSDDFDNVLYEKKVGEFGVIKVSN